MATSIPSCNFAASPMLKTHFSLPVKTLGFSRIRNVKIESLKDVCKQGNIAAAVDLFTELFLEKNRRTGFAPDEAYASVIELCASTKALSLGEQIHGHLITSGVGCGCNSVFLVTKLVMMYGKCGSVEKAWKVFDKMPERTTFTWNGIIGACISSGDALRTLRLYRDMRDFGALLDACTFPSVLKGCGSLRDLRTGAEVHGFAVKCGYVSVGFVVNALVAMYSKCDDIVGARRLFDGMVQKDDVVLWNCMISAYAVNGCTAEAVDVFREMQREGVVANTYTFVAALQACEELSFRSIGRQIHASVLRSGSHLDIYVGNALLAFYARYGEMSEAAFIFDDIDQRDHITWNTMLSGLAQNGLNNKVLSLFQDGLDEGVIPDQVSVISVAMASGRLGKLLNGKEVHAYAVKHGLSNDLHVGNTLLDMYSKCASVVYMSRIFDRMVSRDLVSITTVIAGYAQNNCHFEALYLFRKFQIESADMDPLMIGSVLLACSRLKSVSLVKEVHAYILRRGISDLALLNNIVDLYGECGFVDYAARAFELIEIKDVVTWTSLITYYANNGLAKEALELFVEMQNCGIQSDYVVLLSLLSAVTSWSALRKGKEVHGFLLRKGTAVEGSILNALVDMYSNCGSLESACMLFDSASKNDLTLWTSMINGYGMHGHGKASVELFQHMENVGIRPDHITFLALLQACSHSGLVDEGKRQFENMKKKYELEPWPEHYVCMVDLLGRANHLDEAFHCVLSMVIKPTAEIWCSLLSSCRIHSNEKLGSIAAEKLLALDPENPGNYVLISNTYASSRRWNDVDKVRLRMKENEMKKNPGCSWIEFGNTIHTFTAHDHSHPQSNEIYQKLAEVTKKLEQEGGYVAQTSLVLRNVAQEEKAKILHGHSERLAIAYGLIKLSKGTPIRITKNLRVCADCHTFCKLVSKIYNRELIIRDAKRFHHFRDGSCSCRNFW